MRLVTCLFVLVLAACGSPPTPGVTIERLPSGDWRATWQAAEPVRSLRFVRPAHYLREREWRVVTPGYAFGRDGDAQVLHGVDGAAPSTKVVIDFPVNTAFMPRDYELFNVFSDGSAALYTGHFLAAVNGAAEPMADVTVLAPPGQRVVIDPQPGTHGTYAYVGTIEPVDHARVVALIDPGLPRWLEATLAEQIPALFDFYEARTGQRLEHRPVVLFSFVPGRGADINGGVLDNLVQLRATGDAWHDDNPWTVRQALRIIAHEAAHLWNNQLARFRPGSPPWMHEGAAEAFADEALYAAALMDTRALSAAYEHALNACVAGQRRHYTCGQIAAWWTGLAVADATPDADLFSFWGALAARAADGDGHYGTDDYFAELEAQGVSASEIAQLRAFTERPDDVGAAVSAGVARYGVLVARDDAAAGRDARLTVSGEFVLALLAGDCRGTYGFYTREGALELAGLDDCSTAREGMVIDGLGGEPLDAPDFAAARAVLAQCADEGRVTAGPATFACPDELPPLRGYWTITGESQ